jgi:hypothetical protein
MCVAPLHQLRLRSVICVQTLSIPLAGSEQILRLVQDCARKKVLLWCGCRDENLFRLGPIKLPKIKGLCFFRDYAQILSGLKESALRNTSG